ncbi:hypothetical protein [Lysinibacillus sp. BPa_S21]
MQLVSIDFFDADIYPKISFTSTYIRKLAGNSVNP